MTVVVIVVAMVLSVVVIRRLQKDLVIAVTRERVRATVATMKTMGHGVTLDYLDEDEAEALFDIWLSMVRLDAGELRQCACGVALLEQEQSELEHEGIKHTDKWCDTI